VAAVAALELQNQQAARDQGSTKTDAGGPAEPGERHPVLEIAPYDRGRICRVRGHAGGGAMPGVATPMKRERAFYPPARGERRAGAGSGPGGRG
jgi:hypothetical protein